MAKRMWMAKWSMGYVGTDSEEEVDLVEEMGLTEEEVEEMTDEEANDIVADFAYEQAVQMVYAYAEPLDT